MKSSYRPTVVFGGVKPGRSGEEDDLPSAGSCGGRGAHRPRGGQDLECCDPGRAQGGETAPPSRGVEGRAGVLERPGSREGPAEGGRSRSAPIDDLAFSRPVIDEVLSVLASKFSRDSEELSRVAVLLGEMGEIVEPTIRLDVLRDEPGNRILECGVEGKAEAIVTGDKAMLSIGEYEGIRLITLADNLKKPGRRR
jgi:predicted nucleic acid-binding protein